MKLQRNTREPRKTDIISDEFVEKITEEASY